MQDVHVKLNPEFVWQEQHSSRRHFLQKIGLKFKKETSEMLRFEHSFVARMVLKHGHFGKKIRNTSEVLICRVGEG
jgi:hypothetical protein